jgi:NitT/TauT family transport system permease protein
MKYFLRTIVPPVLTIVLIAGGLELAVYLGWIRAFILPPPSKVLAALFDSRAGLWPALWVTARSALEGFAMAVAMGVFIAIVLSSSKWLRAALLPYTIFFQTVPIIAIAPMLVIWLGIGPPTVRAAACIASIFPVIANTYAGLASVDPALRDLFKLYNAGWFSTLFRLRLPFALPQMMTGLKVSAGLAVIGAMVGELVGAAGGLGSVIEISRTLQRNDRVFAAVLLSSVLGLVLFLAVSLLSTFMLRHWHASETVSDS